jgi:RND superfamily putative drug exporter
MTTLIDIERPVGPVGRLGSFATRHARAIFAAWAVVIVVLAAFAPRVEHALSGAGWQADGSESVEARALIDRSFAGQSSSALTVVVHSPTSSSGFRTAVRRVEHVLAGEPRVAGVHAPTISPDGHTAVISAGANGDPTTMVAAAGDLKPRLEPAARPRSGTRSTSPTSRR